MARLWESILIKGRKGQGSLSGKGKKSKYEKAKDQEKII